MVKVIAHIIMTFNFLFGAAILLPSCSKIFPPEVPSYTVGWKLEKVNGSDVFIYECREMKSSLSLTIQACDTKQECNQYCERMRGYSGR